MSWLRNANNHHTIYTETISSLNLHFNFIIYSYYLSTATLFPYFLSYRSSSCQKIQFFRSILHHPLHSDPTNVTNPIPGLQNFIPSQIAIFLNLETRLI
ncbi:hypothetical protein QVD17_24598 [Tagetes erecta]|uniref:Uncharacterized protein n=1 Tax=Tagetes erecta TaxID=13708 RepID=A0AAD8KLR4_TARER|nr:hypothetical protein QVD17_24598 [Tagetes erecta]